MLLLGWQNLTTAQKGVICHLERACRRTFRACQLKEELRAAFKIPLFATLTTPDERLACASLYRLAPFVNIERPICKCWPAIEATIDLPIVIQMIEGNSAAIGCIHTHVGGVHDTEAFLATIKLDRAGIRPDLSRATVS